MKKLISLLLSLAITTSVFAGGSYKQNITLHNPTGQAVVQGVVYDAYTSLGLEGVTVGAIDFTTTTLDDGSYTLVVDEGNYDLYFLKEGWITHVVPALLMVDTLNIDVTLQRLPLGFPFTEDWSTGSFETNLWSFEPEQGNWQINDTIGNPEPAVIFTGDTATTDYSFALVSHEIDLSGVFQNLALYFDLNLITNTPGSQEYLIINLWDGISWINIDTLNSEADITLTTYYFDITNIAAGKTIKLRFLAQGLDASNLDHWMVDNIQITHPPYIVVSPSSFNEYFSVWFPGTYYFPMTIYNDGLAPLSYDITITRHNPFNFKVSGPAVKHEVRAIELSTDPDPQPGGEPDDPSQNGSYMLHYDGPNWDAIGLTAGGTFHVAARFPSSMVVPYAGYALESVDVYINDVPGSANLKIWGAGTGTAPGAVLHQQTFTSTPNSWITVTLTDPLVLDGTDIWVGCEITHDAGRYPAGCDAGPANPNGDWLSTDGVVWEHLAGYGLNYNWNIRARLEEGPIQWLDVQPRSGFIAGGSDEVLDVIFITYSFELYSSHDAFINIATNDPLNPLVVVPVHVDVANFINEVDHFDWAVCFPVPASDQLFIEAKHELTRLRVTNNLGQVFIDQKVSENSAQTLDVKHLPTGLYFLQADAKDGKVYSRKILISR
jgi:hypothetical protein